MILGLLATSHYWKHVKLREALGPPTSVQVVVSSGNRSDCRRATVRMNVCQNRVYDIIYRLPAA